MLLLQLQLQVQLTTGLVWSTGNTERLLDCSAVCGSHLPAILIDRSESDLNAARSERFSAKMSFTRLLSRAVLANRVGSRCAFTSSKPDTANPNWLRVGLAFGTSALLWGLLFKQHSTDVDEYKVRNGLQ
ncbi:NADH dehydrogenase [ubiquinone] 1 subunit C1, mitochondrial isoform 2-T2 [Odontesthes bonariensis]|uniref:NADH dehydrogenase [ubiquinone] 1 subunit C1, mitochondrial isoform X2 n=1 Tax=Odontesthes bonariensis TaxID=219752 RepID=UPI003F587C45